MADDSTQKRPGAEKIVADLAKRGEARVRDIQKSARELADRSTRNRQDLVRLIQKEIRVQLASLGLASRDEVQRLQKRVKELEAEQKQARKPVRKSTKAKSTKAKPARSKSTKAKPTKKSAT